MIDGHGVENIFTLAVEVLQESLEFGRLGVVFPLFGGPLPGSHDCVDRQRERTLFSNTVDGDMSTLHREDFKLSTGG